ncbi:hypothetical protein KJI95_03835 [Shewanella sp. JM162201]|uniref:HTH cro/C1-type domain-containing protein n=1 Tax=Shewanella jiangmenensis TaxID=2837387 RepID=A0ABS5UZM5_9GAMM|nr:hypothetical protein [Shewanella jiangmenensis]MBT1443654.1 hypothetical protein [Shewanella jiangmenensis]
MKIRDLETNRLMSAGELIRTLVKRSGLSRNQVHEEMKRRVGGRSIGAASKLSDIFADRRQLPLRDLVPLFDSIPMKKSERDYYLCELIKAYTDENLARYIKSPSKSHINNQRMLLEIDGLKREIKNYEYLMFMSELKMTSKTIYLENDSLTLDELHHFERNDFSYNYEEHEKDVRLSEKQLEKYLSMWDDACMELIKTLNNPKLMSVIHACMSKNLQFELNSFLRWEFLEPMESTWSWLNHRVSKVSVLELNSRLFSMWMKEFPEAFNKTIELISDVCEYDGYTPKYLSSDYTSWSKNLGFPSFYEYMAERHLLMRQESPTLFVLLNPLAKSFSPYILSAFRRMSLEMLEMYVEHSGSGWMDIIDFSDLFSGEFTTSDVSGKVSKLANTIMLLSENHKNLELSEQVKIEIIQSFHPSETSDYIWKARVERSFRNYCSILELVRSKSEVANSVDYFDSLVGVDESYSGRLKVFNENLVGLIRAGMSECAKEKLYKDFSAFDDYSNKMDERYKEMQERLNDLKVDIFDIL